MVEGKLEIWLENWEKNWWHKLVAIIALVNFALVLFNATYVPFRDFYFREIPPLVHLYDRVKGIEPHPDTQHYLETVEQLAISVPQKPLDSTEVQKLFLSLRLQSA
ncbi:MAG: hypothetical protein F6K24_49270, partial [Okeania sp. SIO2D1]|nr:hypothetical protein [Okeania sp. SIO2D1]